MTDDSPVIGIDLGTTNSVVAISIDGQVRVLEEGGTALVPSVVGIGADGRLLVGQSARNQLAAFPDRTIASVKRRMGQAVTLPMAGTSYTPQEISSVILQSLKARAERALGRPVSRAVITVPAFFGEPQRQATLEAGRLAGLTVERIINEPTAASLVYHAGSAERRHVMIYDLGGGTFDVSIVRMERGVVEVLSSKGDTSLGGDDFDELLAQHVAGRFLQEHGHDLMAEGGTRWRLLTACERAKCELSTAATARIVEEFIATVRGRQVSLDVEVSRDEYERLIRSLVDRTIGCVDMAIVDAGLSLSQIDELILVGGSTRTPLVQRRLREEFRREPRWSVDPDLAVALGAATQAAAIAGLAIGPVLVDVATHTLGIAAVSEGPHGEHLAFCPILHRNATLPARYEDLFLTHDDTQDMAAIEVFQGESPRLEENREIGHFMLEGLNASSACDGRILVRFELSLDGTLEVTAIESKSGISQRLAIVDALSTMKDAVGAAERLGRLPGFSSAVDATAGHQTGGGASDPAPTLPHAAILYRAKRALATLGPEDAADVERLLQLVAEAQAAGDDLLLGGLVAELDDLLFYAAG
ncbi:MAG: Hsp70 family protein [Planctomycetes bacterium]|nr:Hsp70 family protein [Planctomycetota bacterium]